MISSLSLKLYLNSLVYHRNIFEEDTKMFRWYTDEFKYNLRDKVDISEIIDIFACEDIISSHERISYRFYQLVTTRIDFILF